MTDFQGALEKALYDRLKSQVAGAGVYQHVPDTTPPPVVILSDVDFGDEGDKDEPLLNFSVAVVTVTAGPSRKPLNALQAQVRGALDRWTPAATAEVLFGEVRVSDGGGQEVQGEHGPIYFGKQMARVYVQRA